MSVVESVPPPEEGTAGSLIKALGEAITALRLLGLQGHEHRVAMEEVDRAMRAHLRAQRGERRLSLTSGGGQLRLDGCAIPPTIDGASLVLEALGKRQVGGISIERDFAFSDLRRLLVDLIRPADSSGAMVVRLGETEGSGGREHMPGCFLIASREPSAGSTATTGSFCMERLPSVGAPEPPSRAKSTAPRAEEFGRFDKLHASVVSAYRAFHDGSEANYPALVQKVAEVLQELSKMGATSPWRAQGPYWSDFTIRHSVQVFFLTAAVASRITSHRPLLVRICLAALLHDIGKRLVPAEILEKKGKLTPAELLQMQEHPRLGAELLLQIQGVDPFCVTVAFGHHRIFGQPPYPETRRSLAPDLLTRLVSLVDMYEALTAARPYKRGISPLRALTTLIALAPTEEDRSLVRLFLEVLGPYPTGSVVGLSSGERAVVVEHRPRSPHKPVLCVLTDERKSPLSEPWTLDLEQPETSLGPASHRSIVGMVVPRPGMTASWEGDLEPLPRIGLESARALSQAIVSREG